jgi:hypothetical protein
MGITVLEQVYVCICVKLEERFTNQFVHAYQVQYMYNLHQRKPEGKIL